MKTISIAKSAFEEHMADPGALTPGEITLIEFAEGISRRYKLSSTVDLGWGLMFIFEKREIL